MEFIVDFQSFKLSSNEFAIKELAILKLNSNEKPKVFLFKPPCKWWDLPLKCRVENNWLERNYLTLSWESGDIPYNQIENILKTTLSNADKIFVKGLQKVKYLEKYLNNVKDMETITKCPSLRVLKKWNFPNNLCKYHRNSKMVCAVYNVLLLEKYIIINKPCLERSLEIFSKLKQLSLMETEDIAKLPKDFIINLAAENVNAAWEKFPKNYKNDYDIFICLRCRIHDHSDKRVAPMIKDCKYCMQSMTM